MCDCKPLLRVLLLVEGIWAASRCAEQLRCADSVCSLDRSGPNRACLLSTLWMFTCCCILVAQRCLFGAKLLTNFIPEIC